MYGFIRAVCATPEICLANCEKNADSVISLIKRAKKDGAAFAVFPELCITGYTCADLFLQQTLQKSALHALAKIAAATACDAQKVSVSSIIAVVGLPFGFGSAVYNVAAICAAGRVLALVPKTNIPNYGEFYEKRYFAPAFSGFKKVVVYDEDACAYDVPFGTDILLYDRADESLAFACEICEDLWVPSPPSVKHTHNGAIFVANLSASNETAGKSAYRRMLVQSQSARLSCAYLYADTGEGESTTDLVFAAHNMIAENGALLDEKLPFATDNYCVADIDAERLLQERRKNTSFAASAANIPDSYLRIPVSFTRLEQKLRREINPHPFIPADSDSLAPRCREIFDIQTAGLMQRLRHTKCSSAVLGISGGLDSTLALLVTCEAFKRLSLDMKGIIAVTMPCFGTTDRTYNNALTLSRRLSVTLREIPLQKSVLQHFADIGHDPQQHDTTFENAQARERTQILMDIANSCDALVVGTGDLSELALGWTTYNGDHMSMYGVNASVPKTLIRHITDWFAKNVKKSADSELAAVLVDILDTPVSPELLPLKDGVMQQKTEDIVGSYELHDFFLYYFLRWGFSPDKILFLAEQAFKCGTKKEEFSREEIRKRLKLFVSRFFSQQFKRSCLPDGAKVGTVSLSPRGDWRMPSDACAAIWLESF